MGQSAQRQPQKRAHTHTHTHTHSQRVTHIVEISHTLANVTLSGPDWRTDGRREGGTERKRARESEGPDRDRDRERELGAEG